MKRINPYCVLGGAGVCQKTGVLLSAEQRPPSAQLRPGPGAEHVPHSPSAENSAAYSGVTAHERGGLGRFIGDRGYQRLCVEEAKSVFSLSHVCFSWFSVTAVTVRSFFSLYKYVRLRRMRFEGRGTW